MPITPACVRWSGQWGVKMSVSLYMLFGIFCFLGGSYMMGIKHMHVENKVFRHAWVLAMFSPIWPIALIIYLIILVIGNGD